MYCLWHNDVIVAVENVDTSQSLLSLLLSLSLLLLSRDLFLFSLNLLWRWESFKCKAVFKNRIRNPHFYLSDIQISTWYKQSCNPYVYYKIQCVWNKLNILRVETSRSWLFFMRCILTTTQRVLLFFSRTHSKSILFFILWKLAFFVIPGTRWGCLGAPRSILFWVLLFSTIGGINQKERPHDIIFHISIQTDVIAKTPGVDDG